MAILNSGDTFKGRAGTHVGYESAATGTISVILEMPGNSDAVEVLSSGNGTSGVFEIPVRGSYEYTVTLTGDMIAELYEG